MAQGRQNPISLSSIITDHEGGNSAPVSELPTRPQTDNVVL